MRGRDRRGGRGQIVTDPPADVRSQANRQSVLVEGVALGVVEFPVRKPQSGEVPLETERPRSLADVGSPKPELRPFN